MGCVLKEEDDIIVLQTAPAVVNNPAAGIYAMPAQVNAFSSSFGLSNQYSSPGFSPYNSTSLFESDSFAPNAPLTPSASLTPNNNSVQFRK